ncbi:hypothetical protein QBC34DRAFT_202410 [Podospora aff. communis PSN243]|uniref:Uncharacterized protein n=1 Tax=Podospora aff. communis PSN243 TaxID=3040156 RepID=A0AAV9GY25_9PEZI|nr:hypothetical protein QBC34DRAFT_202410 [Podospora aff. communis PSN243]
MPNRALEFIDRALSQTNQPLAEVSLPHGSTSTSSPSFAATCGLFASFVTGTTNLRKMASSPAAEVGKRIPCGPLRKPQPRSIATSYTQSPPMKSEISVGNKCSCGRHQASALYSVGSLTSSCLDPPAFREVSLTSTAQPFVNPGDAFKSLNSGANTT